MKKNVFFMKQQAQEFILRLFVESSGDHLSSHLSSSSSYYTGAHCGTFSRIRQ